MKSCCFFFKKKYSLFCFSVFPFLLFVLCSDTFLIKEKEQRPAGGSLNHERENNLRKIKLENVPDCLDRLKNDEEKTIGFVKLEVLMALLHNLMMLFVCSSYYNERHSFTGLVGSQ